MSTGVENKSQTKHNSTLTCDADHCGHVATQRCMRDGCPHVMCLRHTVRFVQVRHSNNNTYDISKQTWMDQPTETSYILEYCTPCAPHKKTHVYGRVEGGISLYNHDSHDGKCNIL